MDRAVRPAYRGGRKGETNFILSASHPERKRELGVGSIRGHRSLFQVSRDPARGGDSSGRRIMRNGPPSTETAFTLGRVTSMEMKCHLVFNTLKKIGNRRKKIKELFRYCITQL